MLYVICMSDRVIDVPLVGTIKHLISIVCDGGIFAANPAGKGFLIVNFYPCDFIFRDDDD